MQSWLKFNSIQIMVKQLSGDRKWTGTSNQIEVWCTRSTVGVRFTRRRTSYIVLVVNKHTEGRVVDIKSGGADRELLINSGVDECYSDRVWDGVEYGLR